LLSTFLAVYATWVWLEIHTVRAGGPAESLETTNAAAGHQSVRTLWRAYRRPALAFSYLFFCSIFMFYFFFLNNSQILNFIRWIDSLVGMK
jgi:hypothetical protein